MKTVLFIFMTGLLVLVSSYAGGEILLRLFHPQFCLLGFSFLEPDDILRHRNQPDLRLKWTTSEINGDFFTNSQGFRNKNDIPGPAKAAKNGFCLLAIRLPSALA